MITVHHLNNSRSQRILWLLEELHVPYEVKRYERNSETMFAPPELLAVHPLGKSPVVTDSGRTLAETGAIVEHLVTEYGGGRMLPFPGSEDRFRYRYWLHFAEGSAMPPLVMTILVGKAVAQSPALVRPITRRVESAIQSSYIAPMLSKQLDLMEAELGRGGWFAGSIITAADIMMSFPVEAAVTRGGLGARARLKLWLDRIHARPAYKAALAKGGAYAYA